MGTISQPGLPEPELINWVMIGAITSIRERLALIDLVFRALIMISLNESLNKVGYYRFQVVDITPLLSQVEG